jgi:hypothetical protein
VAKRRRLAKTLAAVLAIGAPARAEPPPPPNVVRPALTGAAELIAALEAHTVTSADYARSTLYTWTTRDQIAALRKSSRLLVRDRSPDRGASYVELALFALAGQSDPIAKLLFTETYAKARFAWPAPWATVAGFDDEDYGDQLIAVKLKPDAIVVALTVDDGITGAHDLANRPIDLGDVAKHPERIAAIYFTAPWYREYVLCNEAMIDSWSVGTDAIARELADEAVVLDAAGAALADAQVARAYEAAIAFRDNRYEQAHAGDLAKRLRAAKRLPALVVRSTMKFPGIGKARGPVYNRGRYGSYVQLPRRKKP